VQWNSLYETAETRKIRVLSYYAKPNKLIGEGIGFTLAQPNGPHLLGMWALLEALASTAPQEHRGWLVRNGTPLDAQRMSSLTRVSSHHFNEALTFFCRPEVRWLEHAEWAAPSGHSAGAAPSPVSDRDNAGTPSGHSAGAAPSPVSDRDNAGRISPRGKIDGRGKTDEGTERKKNGGSGGAPAALDPEAARQAQKTQWAALSARIRELEAVPEEERTPAQDDELKKTRRAQREIQKKQAAGDFTPLREVNA